MEQVAKAGGRDFTRGFNRIMYGGFILLGLYFLLISGDLSDGASNFAIALIFDPFNPKQPFGQRPMYQKVWLVVHAAVAIGLLVYSFLR